MVRGGSSIVAVVGASSRRRSSRSTLKNIMGLAMITFAATIRHARSFARPAMPTVGHRWCGSAAGSDSSSRRSAAVSTSVEYALDPDGSEADDVLTTMLGVSASEEQRRQLKRLALLVVEWNERINLVSRVDCTKEVVFGRHILPSAALVSLLTSQPDESDGPQRHVADVGTGGGFPGLPLAVLLPSCSFTLVDSTGKKLRAVRAMADELGLVNVHTHHGRVEEMDVTQRTFDVVLGRSVAPLPKFCCWVDALLTPDTGRVVYIIGGAVPPNVSHRCEQDVPLDTLLRGTTTSTSSRSSSSSSSSTDQPLLSDKRALVLSAASVTLIAKESGEKKVTVRGSSSSSSSTNKKNNNNTTNIKNNKKKKAKGKWEKTDNSVPKERGYENFKRYSA